MKSPLLCALLVALTPAFACTAQSAPQSIHKSLHAVGRLAEVALYDRTENRSLPVYFHKGRYYVAGKPGNTYQIQLRNRQSRAILAVVSVDAVNVISGETASWDSIGMQTGYVFDAGMAWDIRGWRKSMERIAGFHFTELDNSYAARTGRPGNVGVIGVAVFREKRAPVSIGRRAGSSDGSWGSSRDTARNQGRNEAQGKAQEGPPAERSTSQAAGHAEGEARFDGAADHGPARASAAERARPQSAPAPASKSLGTGHGASETSMVSHTDFERASSRPDEVITIHYDSHANLVAQGVIPAPVSRLPVRPDPFPGYRSGPFVPDPS